MTGSQRPSRQRRALKHIDDGKIRSSQRRYVRTRLGPKRNLSELQAQRMSKGTNTLEYRADKKRG